MENTVASTLAIGGTIEPIEILTTDQLQALSVHYAVIFRTRANQLTNNSSVSYDVSDVIKSWEAMPGGIRNQFFNYVINSEKQVPWPWVAGADAVLTYAIKQVDANDN